MRVKSYGRWSVFTKVCALLLAVVLVVSGLKFWEGKDSVMGAASSSSTSNTTRVSVHDPSVFYDSSSGSYYIYGSHLAQAKSTDSRNGSTVGTQASKGESLATALASSFLWAGYNDQDCSGGYAVWAPDIIYNSSYVWNDGSKGAYMMYYSTSSTYIRSCIGYAVSKSASGPFSYVDTIVYSGFTNGDNNVTTSSSLGTKTVNTNYTNTNIPALISEGKLSGVSRGWFNGTAYNNTLFPNAIDPTVLFDASGNLWMTYGSWSVR